LSEELAELESRQSLNKAKLDNEEIAEKDFIPVFDNKVIEICNEWTARIKREVKRVVGIRSDLVSDSVSDNGNGE
jgi:hypothetical protein